MSVFPVYVGGGGGVLRLCLVVCWSIEAVHFLICPLLFLCLCLVQTTDDDTADLSDEVDAGQSSGTPPWMRQLREQANQWLGILPNALPLLTRTEASIKDPMFRFYERETTIGSQLLKQVRSDLQDVIKCCEGEMKQTNHLRSLMNTLVQGLHYFVHVLC